MKGILVLLLLSCSLITYAQDRIPTAAPGVKYGKEIAEVRAIRVQDLEEKLQMDTFYQGQLKERW